MLQIQSTMLCAPYGSTEVHKTPVVDVSPAQYWCCAPKSGGCTYKYSRAPWLCAQVQLLYLKVQQSPVAVRLSPVGPS